MDLIAATPFDGQSDHLLDSVVALVVVERHNFAVAIDPEGELGEVIGSDREAVKILAKLSINMTLLGISHIA